MQYFNFKFKAMGTPCEIQLYAENESHARNAANQVINDVNRLEALYSRYREDSFLSGPPPSIRLSRAFLAR